MKFYTVVLVGLLCVSASAFGALSVEDYEKLNTMFKESEARMKEHFSQELAREIAKVNAEIAKVNAEIRRLDSRIDETNKRTDDGFQAVNNRFGDVNSRLNLNFGLLVALIGVVIGLPLLRERKKEREQDEQLAAQQALIEKQQEQLAAQQQELEAVRQELATLKQHQMPSPLHETPRTP